MISILLQQQIEDVKHLIHLGMTDHGIARQVGCEEDLVRRLRNHKASESTNEATNEDRTLLNG